MKKIVLIILISIGIVFMGSYASITIYTKAKLDNAEENIKEHHPEITSVESIKSIGHWGEWFTEYSLVVSMDDKKYRIWTSGNGEITDKMKIE